MDMSMEQRNAARAEESRRSRAANILQREEFRVLTTKIERVHSEPAGDNARLVSNLSMAVLARDLIERESKCEVVKLTRTASGQVHAELGKQISPASDVVRTTAEEWGTASAKPAALVVREYPKPLTDDLEPGHDLAHLSKDEFKCAMMNLKQQHSAETVKALFRCFGYCQLSDIPEQMYPAIMVTANLILARTRPKNDDFLL